MDGGFRVQAEAQTAGRRVPLIEKFIYTAISLFVFLLCSRTPLYGVHSTASADPFYRMRLFLVSSGPGTVMDLGIIPIVTSGLVIQLLMGSKIIEVDNNVREDRALLNGAQKLLAIWIAVGYALGYVLSGTYGSVSQLGVGNAILVVLQLCFGGIIAICLDEGLREGYGLFSGITLFMAANICGSISWKACEGAAVGISHLLTTVLMEKFRALREANLLTYLVATVLVSLAVLYLQGFFRVVRSRNARGQHSFRIEFFQDLNYNAFVLKYAFALNLIVTLCAIWW